MTTCTTTAGETIEIENGDYVISGDHDGRDIGEIDIDEDGVIHVAWEVGACVLPYPQGLAGVTAVYGDHASAHAAWDAGE